MGKKRSAKSIEEEKPEIWCYYCDREFDDERILIQHQKAKHFKCDFCNKKLTTASGLAVHCLQVHKEAVTKVPNAKPERESVDIEVYGMAGIPEEFLHKNSQQANVLNPIPSGSSSASLGGYPPNQSMPAYGMQSGYGMPSQHLQPMAPPPQYPHHQHQMYPSNHGMVGLPPPPPMIPPQYPPIPGSFPPQYPIQPPQYPVQPNMMPGSQMPYPPAQVSVRPPGMGPPPPPMLGMGMPPPHYPQIPQAAHQASSHMPSYPMMAPPAPMAPPQLLAPGLHSMPPAPPLPSPASYSHGKDTLSSKSLNLKTKFSWFFEIARSMFLLIKLTPINLIRF